MSPPLIPVSIVTGFLGSGKTTLISRLLRAPDFARTAVIVNEFGEIGLDHDLVAHAEDDLITLSTGCLCCAVRGDLVRTLLDLSRRRDTGRIPYFERVVIETSGLADPAPVLQALVADADVALRHAIDTVLTVVDCVHGAAALARHPEARRQAALADVILLSKTDIASPSPELRAALDVLNASAPRIEPGEPKDMFAGADPAARAARLLCLPAAPATSPFLAASHSEAVDTFFILRDDPIPGAALTLLLEALAEHCGPKLLRLKGLVEIAEMPGRPAVIHGVQHIFAEPEWLDSWPSSDRRTRLVFIAQGVPRHFPARLLAAIEAELAGETTARWT